MTPRNTATAEGSLRSSPGGVALVLPHAGERRGERERGQSDEALHRVPPVILRAVPPAKWVASGASSGTSMGVTKFSPYDPT